MSFEDEFNRLRRHVEAAIADNQGTQTIEDVIRRLHDGSFKMWTTEAAILITEMCKMPNKTFLNIVLGGGDLEQIKQMVNAVEQEAKTSGLNGVMIVGRRGWGKVLPNYKDVATLHMKEF